MKESANTGEIKLVCEKSIVTGSSTCDSSICSIMRTTGVNPSKRRSSFTFIISLINIIVLKGTKGEGGDEDEDENENEDEDETILTKTKTKRGGYEDEDETTLTKTITITKAGTKREL